MRTTDHLNLVITAIDRLENDSSTSITERVTALQAIVNAAGQAASRLNLMAQTRQEARQPAPWKNPNGTGY